MAQGREAISSSDLRLLKRLTNLHGWQVLFCAEHRENQHVNLRLNPESPPNRHCTRTACKVYSQLSTLNTQPSTLNTQPSTLNPLPSTRHRYAARGGRGGAGATAQSTRASHSRRRPRAGPCLSRWIYSGEMRFTKVNLIWAPHNLVSLCALGAQILTAGGSMPASRSRRWALFI